MSYFETKINKNQKVSILAPLSAAHIDIFKFIQKVFLTTIHVPKIQPPLTGNVDRH